MTTPEAPTRVEFECAIEQYGVVMATIAKWRARCPNRETSQEMLDALADAERELTRLLDSMPWGDA